MEQIKENDKMFITIRKNKIMASKNCLQKKCGTIRKYFMENSNNNYVVPKYMEEYEMYFSKIIDFCNNNMDSEIYNGIEVPISEQVKLEDIISLYNYKFINENENYEYLYNLYTIANLLECNDLMQLCILKFSFIIKSNTYEYLQKYFKTNNKDVDDFTEEERNNILSLKDWK